MSMRSTIRSGDLPKVTKDLGEQCSNGLYAIRNGSKNQFNTLSTLFQKDRETDIGLAINFMYGLVRDACAGAELRRLSLLLRRD